MLLRRESNGSWPRDRLRQPRQHAEVGVERDPRRTTDAERREAVLVLQAPELALDGPAGCRSGRAGAFVSGARPRVFSIAARRV